MWPESHSEQLLIVTTRIIVPELIITEPESFHS